MADKPRVRFNSMNLNKRIESCVVVARAYGWPAHEIAGFAEQARQAFSVEETMAIIQEKFDVIS